MKKHYALITLILTATFVLAPALTSPFSGFEADQLPNPQIEPPIQPAGYAFAIWGLIYTWLVVSAIYGIWKRAGDAGWNNARAPLIISLAVGTPWLAIANASAIWATITIFIMAIAAIAALLRAPDHDIWLLRVPVAIYAGWLTAASFVSLGSTAAGYGFVTDQIGWAYLGILLALAVTAAVQMRSRAPAYGATVIWALVGIVVANGTAIIGVSALAIGGIIAVAALIWTSQPARDIAIS